MQKSYFGIDFGTTNTAVVHLCIDEYGTKMEYCSEEGMPFSSLLAINRNDGKMLFGRQVKVYNVPACQDTKLKNLSYILLPFLSAYAAIRYC